MQIFYYFYAKLKGILSFIRKIDARVILGLIHMC